jgi:hypothetical protein
VERNIIASMSCFAIYLGASRIKFSIDFEGTTYKGKVNDIIIAESTDFELVRASLLAGMDQTVDISKLH